MPDSQSSISVADAFSFCPRCGQPAETLGENPFRCRCGFSFYFSPTAAVGAIVANQNGEVLFLIRGKNPGKGMLGLPGDSRMPVRR